MLLNMGLRKIYVPHEELLLVLITICFSLFPGFMETLITDHMTGSVNGPRAEGICAVERWPVISSLCLLQQK